MSRSTRASTRTKLGSIPARQTSTSNISSFSCLITSFAYTYSTTIAATRPATDFAPVKKEFAKNASAKITAYLKSSSLCARSSRPNIVRYGVAKVSEVGGKESGQPLGLRVVGLRV
jgi:hypothetical protein